MIITKKAQAVYGIIYLFLAIVALIAIGSLYSYLSNKAECSGLNPSCSSDQYCRVDLKCASFPNEPLNSNSIQTITVNQYSFGPGLLWIGIALIIAYLILRRKN